jgi:hypothetical protein
MESFIFPVSVIIGLFCIVVLTSSDKRRKPTRPLIPSSWITQLGSIPPLPTNTNFRTPPGRISDMTTPFYDATPSIPLRPATTAPRNSHQPMTNEFPTIEKWKKSIVGLVVLSDHHLRLAKTHHSIANFYLATQSAATAVENISRALIHCCGERPEIDQGQTEPLQLLSPRLDETERRDLEEAITIVTLVHLKTKNLREEAEFNQEEMVRIVESASKAVNILKGIIVHHFAAEIPELNIACPKCQSLNLSNFSEIDGCTKHKCMNCYHEWTSIND